MTKLTDLEICKRIAEIDGVKHLQDRGVIILSENYNDFINTICSGRYHPDQVKKITLDYSYNPLTDDALCFRLMVKYRLLVSNDDTDNTWSAYATDKTGWTDEYAHLNRAICLAIIEAHK